jgi:hypothetical protein
MGWCGCRARIIALEIAKSHGVLADVSEAAIIELVMAGLVLYAQIASTDKIGILPADHRDPDLADRLRNQTVPPSADAPESRDSNGFPDGPFFDS